LSRFIVEPFADFLTDAPPLLGRGLHRFRDDDFLDDRQVLGQTRPALTRRRLDRRAPWGLRSHGLRSFSRRVKALKKQQQLLGIELLALRPKEPPHQRVDLFPQQFDFLIRPGKFLQRLLKLSLAESGLLILLLKLLLE
jgi:hypothetical protein